MTQFQLPEQNTLFIVFFKSCILLTVLMSLTACTTHRLEPSREVLAFTLSGYVPFEDSIIGIDPSSGQSREILKPSRNRSYLAFSANSLDSEAVVLAHESAGVDHVIDKLYLYLQANESWRPLLDLTTAYQGAGIISPDDVSVVFSLADKGHPTRYELWTKNLRDDVIKQITHIGQDSSWDVPVGWAPDSDNVLFLRYGRTPHGIASSLLEAPRTGKSPAVLFGVADTVVAAALSPEGQRLALLSRNGIELVDVATGAHSVLVPRSDFGQRRYRSGGLCWSPSGKTIAFELYDPEADQDGIVIAPIPGSGLKVIYVAKHHSLIHHISFLKGTSAAN